MIMISYTMEDIRLLAKIYEQDNATLEGLTPEEVKRYEYNFSYTELMETVIKEKKLSGASLLEFVGAYDCAATNETEYTNLRKFLFLTPPNKMPMYINHKEREAWKSKIARWRLLIGK